MKYRCAISVVPPSGAPPLSRPVEPALTPSASEGEGARQGGDFRRLFSVVLALLVLLTTAALASAETLTGAVTNATTGKPAAGDEVVLLNLSQGMNEAGRTKTDAKGRFSFKIEDSGGPHLVRVDHQGVNYFPAGGPIPPGSTSTEVQVYDSAKKLEGVSENVHLMRMQAQGGTLQVIELIALKNDSKPPRALISDRTWEIYLPEGAHIDGGVAQSPGGMPVNTAPVPDDTRKGLYYYVFPIRPGETRFQVAYHLPYSGEMTLQPRALGKLQHFGVLLPKSMQFSASVPGMFSPVPDQDNQSTLQVATAVTPGKDLSFRIRGEGILPDDSAAGQQQAQAQPGGDMPGRPGGGLGNPEGTPDPLHQYRWAILGACAALLALGGFWVVARSQPTTNAVAEPPQPAPATGNGDVLLHALKEELFQLEMDRQQGRISEAEYATAKSALDQTLQRAIARSQASRA